MKPVYYIKKLKETTKRTEKEAILREAAVDGCIELFMGFQLAYDNRKVFGVKKVPFIEGEFTDIELNAPSSFNWREFETLATKLQTRQLTGNAAKKALNDAASVANIDDWNNFYRNILVKDMRCGVTDTTINSILNELGGDALQYKIYVWEVQLAQEAKKHSKKMIGKKALDPKLDGVRITTILDKTNNSVSMFTRNGNLNANFNHIENYLKSLMPNIPSSIVLDGEMVSANFQSLMTQANRKKNVDTSDAYYALFDALPLSDFEKGFCDKTLIERHNFLSALQPELQSISSGKVYVIPKLIVDLDTDNGQDKMQEFYSESAEAGYEGIMVKDVDSPYECKRSTTWLKWKPSISVDLKIIDVEEGEKGKKNEGRLGALVCEGIEDGKHIIVNVGSGYSDEQRVEFWTNKDSLIGDIVEIEADVITKSKNDDNVYSLRFPRFKRFRSINKDGKI